MKRPNQEWCEPHLEYIRKLETYIDYLESMTTKLEKVEECSHDRKTDDNNGKPNDTLPRKIRKCHFTDKECYESAFKRLCCEMYQTMSKDSFDPKYAHDCYLMTIGVKQ